MNGSYSTTNDARSMCSSAIDEKQNGVVTHEYQIRRPAEATFPFPLLGRATAARALLVFALLNISAPFLTSNRQRLRVAWSAAADVTLKIPARRLSSWCSVTYSDCMITTPRPRLGRYGNDDYYYIVERQFLDDDKTDEVHCAFTNIDILILRDAIRPVSVCLSVYHTRVLYRNC